MMRLSSRDVLMMTQFLVILPHFEHLPFWLTGLSAGVIFSQLTWIHSRLFGVSKVRQKTIQILVFVAGMFGIFQSFHTLLGVEAGSAFLIICLLGKLFEVNSWRDIYVVLTFGLFITAAQFLFDQDLITAIWATCSTLAILLAMAKQNSSKKEEVYFQQSTFSEEIEQTSPKAKNSFKTLAWLVLQAVPLMVILFIFFPRMPPLWTLHLNTGQSKTGISDSMSPGDIADLSQSSELAFRAIFSDGKIPQRSDLYWRGLVLGTFDGRTWKPTPDSRLKSIATMGQPMPKWITESIEFKKSDAHPYQLIMEPTQQSWLFALNLPFSKESQAGLTREFTLRASDEIVTQTTFNLYQIDVNQIDDKLPDWLAKDTLQLPTGTNPKSRAFAAQLFAQVQQNQQAYANAVMSWFRRENFVYTLRPPKLDGDRIDQFLFITKQGFCEHFASSFTFLMRAAGVPARVVVGYQGGKVGLDRKSLEVRQMDAHAWSEVWFAGRGWVRFDPTAMVAPERVRQGMDVLTAENPSMFGNGLVGNLRYNQFKMLGRAREWVDYAKYVWQQKVVGFDEANQESFLFKTFGLRSPMIQIAVMFGAFISVLLLVVGVMWWRRRPVWHPLDAPIIRLSKRLANYDLARQDDEGVLSWLTRLGRHPQYQAQARRLADIYSQARYAENTHNDKAVQKALWRLVNDWRIRDNGS
jgi:transglutaminase-like putative cysteine protease